MSEEAQEISAWRNLVKKYEPKIGTRWKDKRGEYVFFGLVHADDDFYYGLMRDDCKLVLVSCVCELERMFEEICPPAT